MEVLSEYGQVDAVYRLLMIRTAPSFGYMLEKGATTMWEKWQADIDNDIMNSHNQPMLSSCAIWFYKWLAGIQNAGTGFSKIVIAPRVPEEVHHVCCSLDAMAGRISVEWKRAAEGGEAGAAGFEIDVAIPFNTTACVELEKAWSSGKEPSFPGALKIEETQDRYMVEIGSGSYHFAI